jgi:hypothetical protein
MSIVLPIPAPGIYPGIPISKYHSADVCRGPSVSSSGLRNFWKSSAAHFNAEWECKAITNADRRAEQVATQAEAELIALRKIRGFLAIEIETHRAKLRALEDAKEGQPP